MSLRFNLSYLRHYTHDDVIPIEAQYYAIHDSMPKSTVVSLCPWGAPDVWSGYCARHQLCGHSCQRYAFNLMKFYALSDDALSISGYWMLLWGWYGVRDGLERDLEGSCRRAIEIQYRDLSIATQGNYNRPAAFQEGHFLNAVLELCTQFIVPTSIQYVLTQCGRVTQICVFNTVKLGTSARYP